MKNWLPRAAILIAYFFITYVYIFPGARWMFDGRKDIAMSDGTDPAASPMQYTVLINNLRENPLSFFYGAVPTVQYNYPEGMAVWFPWAEKAIIAVTHPFFALEQLYTWNAFVMIFLTALSFYFLGRYLGWSRNLSFAGSIAFAFTAYARARAKVHNTLAGLFHLPLIFLALEILIRRRDKKAIWMSAGLFVLASTVAQYYIILTAFFAPFLLWYFFSHPTVVSNWKHEAKRLTLSVIPAALFIMSTLLFSVPAEMKEKAVVAPKTGDSESWPHPFLSRFAAHPIDFVTGDVAIGPSDLNSVRGWLTRNVQKKLGDSNPHERTNGIRWLILVAAALAFYWALKKKQELPPETQKRIFILISMGFFAMLVSFSPMWFDLPLGPSGWIHAVVSQFRVPSRAGVIVNFCFVLAAGIFLHWFLTTKEFKLKKWLIVPGVLPFLMLLDFPPLMNLMPTARILPAYQSLQNRKECGVGVHFPYVSNSWGLSEFYYFLQRLRGTNCQVLNANATSDRDLFLLNKIPLHPQFFSGITSDNPQLKSQIVKLFECIGLDWIVFDQRVPASWRQSVCQRLGYTLTEETLCLSPQPKKGIMRLPEQCLK